MDTVQGANRIGIVAAIGPSIHGSGGSFGPHSGPMIVGVILLALIILLV